MQNIVLDTNSLIIAVSSRSLYHKVWQSFLNGHYTLCVSNDIVEEYYEVIARNINPRVAEAIVYTILSRENVKRLDPHYRFHLICSDEDDNKFVDCAIVAGADYSRIKIARNNQLFDSQWGFHCECLLIGQDDAEY